MRKSKFFTFIFSMLPGAGQMYQGLMKKGVSIMFAFFAIIALSFTISMEEFIAILPVIWFYSFFDCMNRSNYTVDELSMVEDKMIFDSKIIDGEFINKYIAHKNTFIGWIVILFGVLIFYNNVIRSFLWRLENILPGVTLIANKLPAVIMSVVIIIVGVRLLKGPDNSKGADSYEE